MEVREAPLKNSFASTNIHTNCQPLEVVSYKGRKTRQSLPIDLENHHESDLLKEYEVSIKSESFDDNKARVVLEIPSDCMIVEAPDEAIEIISLEDKNDDQKEQVISSDDGILLDDEKYPAEVQSELAPYENFNNNDIKMEVDNMTTMATRASSECSTIDIDIKNIKEEKQDTSDTDSALGSLSSEEKFGDLKPGQLVWGGFTSNTWWPCIIIEDDSSSYEIKEKGIHVKYFNYGGMQGYLKKNRVFPFESVNQFWHEVNTNPRMDKKKVKKFTPPCLRGIEEANIFLTIDEKDRLDLFHTILKVQKGKKGKATMALSLEMFEKGLISRKFETQLQTYVEAMDRYDEICKNMELVKKEENETKKKKILETSAMKSSIEIKKEEMELAYVRKSIRVVKRRFSEVSQVSSKEGTVISETIDVELPKPKRPKMEKKHIPFEERFKFLPKDITNLFKDVPKNITCVECLTDIPGAKTYPCNNCDLNFHEHCSHSKEQGKEKILHKAGDSEIVMFVDSQKTRVKCLSCHELEKKCFLCKESLSEIKSENFQCNVSDCKRFYHLDCLKNCLQSDKKNSNIRHSCPQHTCHTCISKGINKQGTHVKCLKCPSTYHGDIFCLPAGSQVISKSKIICPRHPTELERSRLHPLNLNYCSMCEHGGNLICCDNCPASFHRECLPDSVNADNEIFNCHDCHLGILPLYNTCVWAKVGAYRWWPAYILTPQEVDANVSMAQQFNRQFCIKFFGSYECHWTTYEKVLICNDNATNAVLKIPSKSRLDHAFKMGVDEVTRMMSILQNEKADAIVTKPKHYAKITSNRPVYPVRLKKDEQPQEPCFCRADDESPCGPDSSCIIRQLRYECSKNCPAGVLCQNQKLRNREYAPIARFRTRDRGFGVRALKDIVEGTLIIEYVGELIDSAEVKRRFKEKKERNDKDYYIFTLDSDLCIDAEPAGNLSRFINHSCDPNCDAFKTTVDGNDRVGIYANKFIKEGTEVTFNYNFQAGSVRCCCGSKKCTGFLGGIKDEPGLKKKKKSKKNNSSKNTKKSKGKRGRPRKIASITEVIETPDPLENMLGNVVPSAHITVKVEPLASELVKIEAIDP